MLKTKVGYSTSIDSYTKGLETANMSLNEMIDTKLGLVFTSCNDNIEEIIKGIRSISNIPIIGGTSSGGVLVNDGIIASPNGFASMMSLGDPELTIGVAIHEASTHPRSVGRKVAMEAVENAKTTRAPSYFMMIASPKDEEEYLLGIQDVIGRVPLFGGSVSDDDIDEKWKIFCNDKVISDGVAVAFFYTDNEIATSFTGEYFETDNVGIITKVENDRTLVEIDHAGALNKYARWTKTLPSKLMGKKLWEAAITKPLGIKSPTGNITVIRQPKYGDDRGTKTYTDDAIELSNKVVENTAIVQLEATIDELIDGVGDTMKDLKQKMYGESAGYILFHSAGRKKAIANRLSEVHSEILKEAKNTPFLVVFSLSEYGYDEHSANLCGGSMLSFTSLGKE